MNHTNHKKHSCCEEPDHKMAMGTHAHHNYSSTMSHGSPRDFLRRFFIVTALLIPLVITDEMIAGKIGIPQFLLQRPIQFIFATAIFWFSLVFFEHAGHEIKTKRFGMMTLVSLAVGAGYAFSAIAAFAPGIEENFFLEVGTLIWVLLFGHYLEARSGAAAGDAAAEVAKLIPRRVRVIRNGEENEIPAEEIHAGDIARVNPGERIPADGIIIHGETNVNEALISGESEPISKKQGDNVIAGSLSIDGSIDVRLSRVGEESTVGRIKKLIEEAKKTKPRQQRVADKAAGILTFVAFFTALGAFLVWSFIVGETLIFSATLAITVLVIACPHALGLAIPVVTSISTSLASRHGIFIKNLSKLEVIKGATYVVFDKTGTLTKGEFGVERVVSFRDGIPENNVLRIASALDSHSSHVIGQSIVSNARRLGIQIPDVSEFKNFPGKGVSGKIGEETYFLGSRAFVEEKSLFAGETAEAGESFFQEGTTAVFLADESSVFGVITLSDSLKQESKGAVRKLHGMGVKIAMLTGDREKVAKHTAEELGIDTYFAEVLPEEKYRYVEKLQKSGEVVIMVGDGINDAPALTQADAGIAIGAGTDVAVEAGDIVLTKNNPEDVARIVVISRSSFRKMKQNLFWALGYNVAAIPAAAGVFAPFGFIIRPEIGALVMSFSTVIVVLNALLLKKIKLD